LVFRNVPAPEELPLPEIPPSADRPICPPADQGAMIDGIHVGDHTAGRRRLLRRGSGARRRRSLRRTTCDTPGESDAVSGTLAGGVNLIVTLATGIEGTVYAVPTRRRGIRRNRICTLIHAATFADDQAGRSLGACAPGRHFSEGCASRAMLLATASPAGTCCRIGRARLRYVWSGIRPTFRSVSHSNRVRG